MRRRRTANTPFAVPLTLDLALYDRALHRSFAEDPQCTQRKARKRFAWFALKDDERVFAAALLRGRPDLILFRSNQRRFCGDFIAVDPAGPSAYVIEIKRNRPLKVDEGVGIQLKNAGAAIRDIARRTGALTPDAPFEKLFGDRDRLLDYLAVPNAERTEASAVAEDANDLAAVS